MQDNLFLARCGKFLSDEFDALMLKIYSNNFDKAVDHALESRDFSKITDYIHSMNYGEYSPYITFQSGIYWNQRLTWEIKNSKYASETYFTQQDISSETLNEWEQAHQVPQCIITHTVMPLPCFLIKSNGQQTFVDLQALLRSTSTGYGFNPETMERFQLQDLHFAWPQYTQIQNLLAAEHGQPAVAMTSFDDVLQQMVDTGDFQCVARYLSENGYKFKKPNSKYCAWNWGAIKQQFISSRFNKKLDDSIEKTLDTMLHKQSASKICMFEDVTMILPVYLQLYSENKYYVDLFALLKYLMVSDKHPILPASVSLDAIKFDLDMYKEILAIRQRPFAYIRADFLKRFEATAADNSADIGAASNCAGLVSGQSLPNENNDSGSTGPLLHV